MKGTFVRSKAKTPRLRLGVLALLLTKVPFISDWKYCQGITKNCLWKVIPLFTCLASEKSPFTSSWKYCQGSTKTCLWKLHNCVWKIPPLHQAENIFEVAQIPCEKWLKLFTDKFFYATLASEKLPKFTCLASKKYW